MNNHRRTTNLLAAGTIVALLLLIYLAFDRTSWTDVFAAATADSSLSTKNTVDNTAGTVDQQTLTLLQEQNAALRRTVETLEARDAEYRTTIIKANETIQTLENSTAAVDVTQADGLASLQQRVQTLQAQNGELARVVQVMQERETQYQNQLQAANAALQTQAAADGTPNSASPTMREHEYEEHESDEHEGYEHESNEHEGYEHEGYEHEGHEHDDD